MPLTMTAEREAEIRASSVWWSSKGALLAELDAERTAHNDTRNEMKLMIPLHEAAAEKDKAVERERAAHQETLEKLRAALVYIDTLDEDDS